VLLPAQMRDYGVDQATIGATFVANSVGFVLASIVSGPMGHRFGMRRTLLGAGVVLVASYLLASARPPLAGLVAATFVCGAATGTGESILQTYVSGLPEATPVMNRLHAYFGVGALAGPLIAAGLLTVTGWPAVMLVMAALTAPAAAVGWRAFPASDVDPLLVGAPGGPTAAGTRPTASADHQAGGSPGAGRPAGGGRLDGRRALLGVVRQPTVLWAGALLCVYVGLEAAVGNWGYTYLVDARSVPKLLAGYTASGYWFGLTAGRFVANPAIARLRLSPVQLVWTCVAGVLVTGALLWAAPGTAGLASLSFVPLGFFLGPIFPTVIAIAHRLTDAHLVPTAIGALAAGGVAGGALFPWLAGTVIQLAGPWTLPPVALLLGVLQLVVWRIVARRLAAAEASGAAGTSFGDVERLASGRLAK
jgi:fucose permease